MKKILILAIAIIAVISLVACDKNKTTNVPTNELTNVPNNASQVVENVPATSDNNEGPAVPATEPEAWQESIDNSAESIVGLVLETHLEEAFPGEIAEFIPINVKIYTKEEIEANEAIKSHNIGEGDIVFDIHYNLLINDGVEDMIKFTVPNGKSDNSLLITDKYNVGICRMGETGYTLDAFGTAF